MFCALVKKSFYLLSNSHELNELRASAVLFAATMRVFHEDAEAKPKNSSWGLCTVMTVTVAVSIVACWLLLLPACDTRTGRVLTIHILRVVFKAAGKMFQATSFCCNVVRATTSDTGKREVPPSFTELEESFNSGGGGVTWLDQLFLVQIFGVRSWGGANRPLTLISMKLPLKLSSLQTFLEH